jgi:hypothetical protein
MKRLAKAIMNGTACLTGSDHDLSQHAYVWESAKYRLR